MTTEKDGNHLDAKDIQQRPEHKPMDARQSEGGRTLNDAIAIAAGFTRVKPTRLTTPIFYILLG